MISQINPRLLENFIKSVRKNKIYSNEIVIEKLDQKHLLSVRDPILLKELIGILANFHILNLNEQNRQFELSETGQKMKSIFLRNPNLFYEIYHLLCYYWFELNNVDYAFLPFKSYQLLCDWIFDHKQYPIAKELADEIDHEIKHRYGVKGSFSEVCIARGIAWLKVLSPPVFDENKKYMVRKPDNIESVLLNLNYYYRIRTIGYGDPLFLDFAAINNLSKASFIDPMAVEDILKDLADRFPNMLKFKYNISGSIVILNREINIEDIT